MLIETDPIDWGKPIVYYQGKEPYPAVLVSKNHKSGYTQRTYGVMVYREIDLGDALVAISPLGFDGSNRVIYNMDASVNDDIKDITEEVASHIDGLGKF